jgi:IS30 family transposase
MLIFIKNIREAAKFIGVQQSTISKYIRKNNFYLGRGLLVYISFTALDEITKSEAYKEAIYKLDNLKVKQKNIPK